MIRVLALCVLLLGFAACGAGAPYPTGRVVPPVAALATTAPPEGVPALRAWLADPANVKGRAAKTGYDRTLFGTPWSDVDHNGCDTRDDILARDLRDVVKDKDRCTVRTGTLVDPYGGQIVQFMRGPGTSSRVQIDHVVSLSNAWQTGAQKWMPSKRLALANDPRNLIAVYGPLNQAKGDGDAATWLPPARAEWCAYGTAQVRVKAAYGLWVTQAEHDALGRLLDTCP